ncbi:MAG: protein kinase [Planctomyces sp.]|nr:protein kinase [Planctomyces sp.]
MPQPGVKELLALLKKSRLLTEEQMADLCSLVQQPDSADLTAEALSQKLVQQNLLTEWQRSQIVRGQTGFVLQQYRLLNPVGRGGMGHVFRALDHQSGEIVAIKVMAKKLSANQTLVKRFRREILASSQLNSPNIVRTLDAGRVGKTDFMVMEYVNGEQLDRLANRLFFVPERICCEIIRQAAVGLQHAFEKQMVHRDIKPANLIVDWSPEGIGTVKVMDMGLVRLSTESEEQKTVTKAGQVMGTPDYMSPEQGWDTTKVDIRSDIYSLGLTFFRMLTGRLPFPGENPLQVLMARCSRDAPSARSFRPEISPEVDAIVRRMTLRDPAARFQTPMELVAALEPLCVQLTRESVRAGSGEVWDSQNDVRLMPTSDPENPDPGYQQFLKEMDSGAAVDLMTASGGSDPVIPQTLPIIDRGSSPSMRRAKSKKRMNAGIAAAVITVIGVGGLIISLTGGGGNANGGGNNVSSGQGGAGETVSLTPLPEATLATPEIAKVHVGESVSVQPQLTVKSAPTTGKLVFALGKTAPASATIQEESGQVIWDVPSTQTPLDYHLPVELYFEETGSARRLVTSTVLTVRVERGEVSYTFPELPNQRILVGQRFEAPFAVTPKPSDPESVRYEITSGSLPGMDLEVNTGRFVWTPSADDVGRHEVVVKLVSVADQKVLATRTLRIAVRPGVLKISIPDFPEQVAKAGEVFRLSLGDRPLTKVLPRGVRMRLASESPRGAELDLSKPELSWPVPENASGTVELRLIVEPEFPDIEFADDSKLETRIRVQIQPLPPRLTPPSEDEVLAEETKLRELLSRDLTQARTATARLDLANQLMERAIDLPDGAGHFAVLNLAWEQAEKARATDLQFEINRLRSIRYGIDENASGLEVVKNFRKSAVSGGQVDLVVEHCLRLAAVAAKEQRWNDVEELLEPAGQLTRGGQGTQKLMAADIDQVRKAIEKPGEEPQTVDPAAAQELLRILQKWQFSALFDQPTTLAFLQANSGQTPPADDGRSRWNINKQRFQLTGTGSGILTGFLETAREADRYVVRFQTGPSTNALQFVFGAVQSQQLNAYLLTLDATGFGRIQKVPEGNVVAEPPNVNIPGTGNGQLVEITVDGDQVTARVNGIQVANQRISDLKPGRIGIVAPLNRPAPGPASDIRQPRILILP